MALNNSDFQRLLNDADASILKEATEKKKKQPQTPRPPGQQTAAQQKRRERYLEILKRKQQKAAQKTGEGGEAGAGYRDRASERRKQRDAVYIQVAEELNELKERSVEESKYLGGDVEHTHLVKGLDLALLAKVRGELSKQQQPQEASKQAAVSAAGKKREPVVVRDGEMRRVCFTLFNKLHPHARRFGQALAALEMRLLTKEEMSCADAARLSGTVSSGNGSKGAPSSFVPLIVRKSALVEDDRAIQESSQTVGKTGPAPVQSKIIKEISEALAWHRENRKKKKEDRLPRRILPKAPGSAGADGEDEDGDIFGGVGGFDAAKALTKAAAEAAASRGASAPKASAVSSDWIREENEMEVEDEEQDGQGEEREGASGGGRGRPSFLKSSSSKASSAKRRLPPLDGQDDTYAECYPSYESGPLLLHAGADSDAESDDDAKALSMMDSGQYRDVLNNQKGGAKGARGAPRTFASRAEYEEYLNSIEYVPKGAFHYGRRHAEEFNILKRKKKPKLNPDQEWKAIEKIIKEKQQA